MTFNNAKTALTRSDVFKSEQTRNAIQNAKKLKSVFEQNYIAKNDSRIYIFTAAVVVAKPQTAKQRESYPALGVGQAAQPQPNFAPGNPIDSGRVVEVDPAMNGWTNQAPQEPIL